MRNWNSDLSRCPRSLPVPASRLPMRNWNVLEPWIRGLRSGFQTTYEELKPAICDGLNTSIWLPDYLWGIETRCSGNYNRGNNASRLPMRNWNIDFGQGLDTTSLLPDYLWGIETLLSWETLWYSFRFQTTYEELKQSILGLSLSIATRFQTTYEELKRPLLTATLAADYASRLPMRNWNGYIRYEDGVPSEASRLPMRNWNTG